VPTDLHETTELMQRERSSAVDGENCDDHRSKWMEFRAFTAIN